MNCVTASASSATAPTIDPLYRSPYEGAWDTRAACLEPDAPSMFADDWGVGRPGRRRRAAALIRCRTCPVRWECGVQALAEVDAGLCLYGVRCGIEFTDVTPSRQERDLERLRAVVANLQPSNGGRPRLIDDRRADSPGTVVEVRREVRREAGAVLVHS